MLPSAVDDVLAVAQSGLEEVLALAALLRRGAEQVADVPAELEHHHQRQDRGASHQQQRLDDLDVRRALHAADGDVEDHQDADGDDGEVLRGVRRDAEQQRHERAGAHHLREQVEDRDDDRGDAGRRAHRTLPHPEGEDVAHRVLARVAQQLRDEQQRDEPRDQEADRVEEAVVAVQRDDPGDAEEGSGRHVVAADRDAVLDAREGPAAGVEVGGGLGVPRRPEGDEQRHRDEGEEQHRGQRLLATRDVGGHDRGGAHRTASRSKSVADLGRQRVDVLDHVALVEPGDEERRDELQEPEDVGDVDVAPQLVPHEVTRPTGGDDIEQIPAQEHRGHREDEPSEVSLEVGELFAAGDGDQPIAVFMVGMTHVPSSTEPRPTAGSRSK